MKCLYEHKESIKLSLGGSIAMDYTWRDVISKTLMLKRDAIQTERESGNGKTKWERFFPPEKAKGSGAV